MNGTVLCAYKKAEAATELLRIYGLEKLKSGRYTIWNTMFIYYSTIDHKDSYKEVENDY